MTLSSVMIIWGIFGAIILLLMNIEEERRRRPIPHQTLRQPIDILSRVPENDPSRSRSANPPPFHTFPRSTPRSYDWRIAFDNRGRRRFRSLLDRHFLQSKENEIKHLYRNWGRTIARLVKLSEENLRHAELRLKYGEYAESVRNAAIGVENATRALLHCYGEKPNPYSGQGEALRILAARFDELRRPEFSNVIEQVTRVSMNREVLKNLPKNGVRKGIFDRSHSIQTVETAKTVISALKQKIVTNFKDEIPEIQPTVHAR